MFLAKTTGRQFLHFLMRPLYLEYSYFVIDFYKFKGKLLKQKKGLENGCCI